MDTSARVHVRTPFPYFGNGWTHCVEIWLVVMYQLAIHFIHATSRVHLGALACVPLSRISGSTGRIMLRYCVLLDPLAMHFTQANSYVDDISMCAGANEHPFKDMFWLPPVLRPKGVLLMYGVRKMLYYHPSSIFIKFHSFLKKKSIINSQQMINSTQLVIGVLNDIRVYRE